jgi:uncharacterized protein YbjT (DUF2867 family)
MFTNNIFITGGTGYIGKAIIPELLKRGYSIKSLVREKSIRKIPIGCKTVIGDALDYKTYVEEINSADTFIHLVGVSHPGPLKADQFRKIDFVSLEQSVDAALQAKIKHFIFLSVAQPAPLMKEYIKVRKECEEILKQSKLNTTTIRPWYVLGPGHKWPYLLIPFYKIFENLSSTKETAKRLGLVSIKQMVQTLLYAVENPATDFRIIDVPEIKRIAKAF